MRRITGVTGAALVVLGFVGFIVGSSVAFLAGPWLLVLTLLMVTIGFVFMWEAQVVWPQDATPYPWRRRLAGLGVGLVTLASAVVTRGVVAAGLPNTWIAHSIAMLAGGVVGDFTFRRLRDAVARRSVRWTPPSPAEAKAP
ncbi:hypothetical protein [Terrabacter ginsenosidimutans]|jgi:hypothetical protein|uniref:hypothetical protein n=1 Tax=Terrabacter ginsenosidimutans TaxID=490575 RepID=UPI0031EF1C47